MVNKDNKFLKRADAHIALANEQMSQEISQGEVSASFMYGAARFNAWLAACNFESKEDMLAERGKIIEYFVKEYQLALEEHIDHHIQHFEFQ